MDSTYLMTGITPLDGAFLADAYLGRFWTTSGFVVFYILGVCLEDAITISQSEVTNRAKVMRIATQGCIKGVEEVLAAYQSSS
ncbi:protein NRT1/ PTR FAMILY 5.1-like [Tripterygium wilfordii]|uniref:protein NRT1/ PTR FAMILY 5.1-like n=1 Tax=Tripterygium wilfordii TaxID=458696 RepID=UPI0018F81EC8|nr:protein NRT1/ PTR FAMILY 5.1-like [Tripterygium wilfordii]